MLIEYMEQAYKEALKAYKKKEIPVGVVIVKDNKIISKAFNNRQKKCNVLGHAEIKAIQKAEKKLKDWRLNDCDMYVTLEPCKMCEMIIKECRINNVYYLLNQNKDNHIFKQTNICNRLKLKYQKLIDNFFKNLRD